MPDPQRAEVSLADLMELSPEMRAGAILAGDRVLAASSEPDRWRAPAAELLAAADAEGAAEQVHVATEAGEVFAVREGELTAIAVTDRFVLASLMAFDMRACLRDLAAGKAAPAAAPEGS